MTVQTPQKNPLIESRTYTHNGVAIREEMIPPMWVVVDTYEPDITPWDYYGNKQGREWSKVLTTGGITCVILTTQRKLIVSHPSGPGKTTRFGDNMLPGIYRVAVRKHSVRGARKLLDYHKMEVDEWLHHDAPMPEVLK